MAVLEKLTVNGAKGVIKGQEAPEKQKEPSFGDFVNGWQSNFIDRVREAVKSRKHFFTFKDAIDKSVGLRSDLDEVMISYFKYVHSNPLRFNDYFKYLNSYKNGKRLDKRYFKHDLSLLHEFYERIDQDENYHGHALHMWKRYVLFMLLKFNGVYDVKEMDPVFKVKDEDGREYNPSCNIARPLRGMLPNSLKLAQYDISRAYPTFIDMELAIDRKEDIYSKIDKKTFNTILNCHRGSKNACIKTLRKQLKPVYGKRVDEVVTEDRFNDKGQMFRDLVKYEKEYIHKFIKENGITKYVRLHDAVFIDADFKIKKTEFGKVKFKRSLVEPPEVINDRKLFYTFNVMDEVETSPFQYKEFFEQENFIRVTIKDQDSITIFKDSNNVVKPFNYKTDTVSFLKSNIIEYDPSKVENKIAKDNSRDIRDSFCLLEPKPLIYYRDDRNSFGIPFKNGFVLYEKGQDGVKVLEYKDVKGFFPEHPSQERTFNFVEEPEISEFERFLTMVSVSKDPLKDDLTSDEDETRRLFFKMFGYLAHSYKSQSFSPSIVLSDYGADGVNRNGGRGKTVIAKALHQVQKTKIRGGNEFDGGYRHRFADLDESYKIYVIDDVLASFNYDNLYTNIVGGISIEPKGQTARFIDFKDAPKFLITTNWAVRYDENATSTNRRFIEFKLTDFFNLDKRPEDVFSHTLFQDWDSKEWNRFYNFVFVCIGLYLNEGLDAPRYDKDEDNFRAYFYNDSLLNEFERIFNQITTNQSEFNVSGFLKVYNDYQNPLRSEKFFHHKNMKTLIDVYLKHKKIPYPYISRDRKWLIKDSNFTESEDLDF